MEKKAHVDKEGDETLLKSIVLAMIVVLLGIIKAVKGGGDSTTFAGRTRWYAIHILKTLPRVYTRTAESVFTTKAGYDKVVKTIEELWDAIFKPDVPRRREGDEL